MEPEYEQWLRENMPTSWYEQLKADRAHDCKWRDERIAELERKLDDVIKVGNDLYCDAQDASVKRSWNHLTDDHEFLESHGCETCDHEGLDQLTEPCESCTAEASRFREACGFNQSQRSGWTPKRQQVESDQIREMSRKVLVMPDLDLPWVQDGTKILNMAGRFVCDFYYEEDDECPPVEAEHRASEVVRLINEAPVLQNRLELAQEDLECVHRFLDTLRVPRADANQTVYSIVGRINVLLDHHVGDVCLCGCPMDEHEVYEEGIACEHGHDCYLVWPAVQQIYQRTLNELRNSASLLGMAHEFLCASVCDAKNGRHCEHCIQLGVARDKHVEAPFGTLREVGQGALELIRREVEAKDHETTLDAVRRELRKRDDDFYSLAKRIESIDPTLDEDERFDDAADPEFRECYDPWNAIQGVKQHLAALHQGLAFAASVIKSGESWTESCERDIGKLLRYPPAKYLEIHGIHQNAGGHRLKVDSAGNCVVLETDPDHKIVVKPSEDQQGSQAYVWIESKR